MWVNSLALQGFFFGQTASNLLHYECSAHSICVGVHPQFVGYLFFYSKTLGYVNVLFKDVEDKAWPFWWLLVNHL